MKNELLLLLCALHVLLMNSCYYFLHCSVGTCAGFCYNHLIIIDFSMCPSLLIYVSLCVSICILFTFCLVSIRQILFVVYSGLLSLHALDCSTSPLHLRKPESTTTASNLLLHFVCESAAANHFNQLVTSLVLISLKISQ